MKNNTKKHHKLQLRCLCEEKFAREIIQLSLYLILFTCRYLSQRFGEKNGWRRIVEREASLNPGMLSAKKAFNAETTEYEAF